MEIALARHQLTTTTDSHYTAFEQGAARQWHHGRT